MDIPMSASPSDTACVIWRAETAWIFSRTWGCDFWKARAAVGSKAEATEGSAQTLMLPRRPAMNSDRSLRESRNSASMRIAMGTSSAPAAVSATPCLSRSKSLASSFCSAACTRRLRAGCEICARSAAMRKLSVSATNSTASNSEMVRVMVFVMRLGYHQDINISISRSGQSHHTGPNRKYGRRQI
ncbi:hypothetical protein D3C73_1104020 [compost metagenome]